MERKTVRWAAGLAAAGLTLALLLVYLRPVGQVWQDAIAPVPEDPVFNLWVLKWGAHQVRQGFPHGWAGFWDANIFYPVQGALALSDHLLGPAAQLALFELVVPNALAGYNFLFITSFLASALATAWVARRSGSSGVAALLAGWAFAFAPFRLLHLNHIQMLIAQWMPLTLWWWDRLLAERTPGNAARFLFFYALHVTGGCYLAYMLHLPLLVVLGTRAAVHGRELLSRRSLRVLLPVAAVAGGLLAALFLPYIEVSRELGLARSPEEIGVLGATLASYFSPSPDGIYFDPPRRGLFRTPLGALAAPFYRSENALFAGFLPTVLGALGLWAAAGRRPSPPPLSQLPPPIPGRGETSNSQDKKRRTWLALLPAAVAWLWGDLLTLTDMNERADLPYRLGAWGWTAPALLLAASLVLWAALRWRLGRPVLPWAGADPWTRGLALSGLACFAFTFPVVYVPLARFVPGLNGMRSPARFDAVVSLVVALFAARGADLVLARLRGGRARWAAGAALLAVLAVELAPKPVHWVPMLRADDFPPVYGWIARQPDVRALLELPIRRNWRENEAMYYSTLHWKPIVNGYSGYEPWSHALIAQRIRFFPDRATIALLRDLGVTHVLIHVDSLGRRGHPPVAALGAFERELAAGPQRELAPAYQDESVRVYRILGPSAVPRTG